MQLSELSRWGAAFRKHLGSFCYGRGAGGVRSPTLLLSLTRDTAPDRALCSPSVHPRAGCRVRFHRCGLLLNTGDQGAVQQGLLPVDEENSCVCHFSLSVSMNVELYMYSVYRQTVLFFFFLTSFYLPLFHLYFFLSQHSPHIFINCYCVSPFTPS